MEVPVWLSGRKFFWRSYVAVMEGWSRCQAVVTWMTSCSPRGLAGAVLGAILAVPFASARTVVYADSEFRASDWEVFTIADGQGGSASLAQEPSGGNPGAYGRVRMIVKGDITIPITGTNLYAFFFYRLSPYTPQTSGAIISITYSEDVLVLPSGAGAPEITGLALRQNGKVYVAGGG